MRFDFVKQAKFCWFCEFDVMHSMLCQTHPLRKSREAKCLHSTCRQGRPICWLARQSRDKWVAYVCHFLSQSAQGTQDQLQNGLTFILTHWNTVMYLNDPRTWFKCVWIKVLPFYSRSCSCHFLSQSAQGTQDPLQNGPTFVLTHWNTVRN